MRRAPFGSSRFIGRVGSGGFTGGMVNPPHGNGPQIAAWFAVSLGGIAIYNYRKYKTETYHADLDHLRRQQAQHDQHLRKQHDQNNDHLRKQHDQRNEAKLRMYELELKAYENRPFYSKGKPPTPPTFE